MNVSIRLCSPCRPDAFQDKEHGRGLRVHNRTKQNKPPIERGWKCTRCGKIT